VKVLIDTCTLIWSIFDPRQLGSMARPLIENRSDTIFVSAASAWEIATKVRIGRLPEAVALEKNFLDDMKNGGFSLLSIDTETALRAGRILAEHRDPFDRMIAAQALSLDIPILSPDSKLDQFGVRRLW
jgi:PIN domain nuclease of toxin-antitoxin system